MIEQERFDEMLLSIAGTWGVEYLVTQVPGVYELVSEHFNNDVIEALETDEAPEVGV
jgi:hypothetical protein